MRSPKYTKDTATQITSSSSSSSLQIKESTPSSAKNSNSNAMQTPVLALRLLHYLRMTFFTVPGNPVPMRLTQLPEALPCFSKPQSQYPLTSFGLIVLPLGFDLLCIHLMRLATALATSTPTPASNNCVVTSSP